jgi:hypothetical protein
LALTAGDRDFTAAGFAAEDLAATVFFPAAAGPAGFGNGFLSGGFCAMERSFF